jgi:hypothetical protein
LGPVVSQAATARPRAATNAIFERDMCDLL